MMIVPELWREAAKFPAPLAWSIIWLVLVFATHAAQALAIAWTLATVISGQTDEVWLALGMILGIAVLRLLLSLVQASSAARLGGLVRRRLREQAIPAALVAPRLHDTTARDGAIRASLGDGIDGTDAYVSKYIPATAQVLLACPLVVITVAILNPWAGAWVGLAVALALTGPLLWKKVAARRGLNHWDSYEDLSADLLESLRGMATLRVLGAVPGTRRRLHDRSEALRSATERVMRVSLAETGVTDFAIQAGVVAAGTTAALHAATGQPPALETYLVLLLASEAFRPIRDLSRHWHAGFMGLTAVPELVRLGAFNRPEHDAQPETPAGSEAPDTARELRIQSVTYRYPGTDHPVFENLTHKINRGTLSAVVGTSGAGKSTLFDVLLGFLTPESGEILLDGQTLHSNDLAVVSQRPVLFTGTIRQNLTVTGARSDAELETACAASGILDEILSFSQGFDTEVTEAGLSLSGGQRQRLALARALLARRPVLLVDEPTSALDAARAAEVIHTLHRVAADRIVLMISHRPESLLDVESVLHLDNDHVDRILP
ncbi:ABC transporter ATPase [Nesterenkonia sp. AN1]|uniref:ABC transporter ATP-binding protein/permease n=1 Tax=Nesterenkonia sp. AN1 TaxID=652017 RepID=UPI00045185AF|nr:ATP-binding cassette domain-containing protein [Nesterenkonia sp. AN1]EXF23876.1 ABC transporter ATPase [Nesterenkonia sp. AN1]